MSINIYSTFTPGLFFPVANRLNSSNIKIPTEISNLQRKPPNFNPNSQTHHENELKKKKKNSPTDRIVLNENQTITSINVI